MAMMLPRIALNWLGASKSRHACGLQDPLLGPSAHKGMKGKWTYKGSVGHFLACSVRSKDSEFCYLCVL